MWSIWFTLPLTWHIAPVNSEVHIHAGISAIIRHFPLFRQFRLQLPIFIWKWSSTDSYKGNLISKRFLRFKKILQGLGKHFNFVTFWTEDYIYRLRKKKDSRLSPCTNKFSHAAWLMHDSCIFSQSSRPFVLRFKQWI